MYHFVYQKKYGSAEFDWRITNYGVNDMKCAYIRLHEDTIRYKDKKVYFNHDCGYKTYFVICQREAKSVNITQDIPSSKLADIKTYSKWSEITTICHDGHHTLDFLKCVLPTTCITEEDVPRMCSMQRLFECNSGKTFFLVSFMILCLN